MMHTCTKTGKIIKLIKGDVIHVKGCGVATILNTNAKKVKILGGDAIVSYDGGQYGTIKQNDVTEVLFYSFSISRILQKIFWIWIVKPLIS